MRIFYAVAKLDDVSIKKERTKLKKKNYYR